ncbi:S41 family peptidase [Nannocystis sp. SCPEA4]|uniref:S41 family peptidase n=1 Tax=Nannocystis sp. SCPEA4 TaxID=2996787 RepID=UPI00227142CA|nr:S41 family peptidase [Nannocystis sp. SCPEA4]MCY1056321.1 S41 family peptidase [Nannocystis sp. SCPEA4]
MGRIDRRFTADQLDRMARAPGLLFDLRPSADASPVLPHLTSAPLFGLTYASVLTAFPGAAGRSRTETQRQPIEPRVPLLTAPAAFLVDERANSAPESALAHVHQHRLAPVFGATTAGTTCDVNQIWFPDGYLVRWTGCLAQWDSGEVFHGTGVPASDPVQPTLAGVAAGRDEVLDAAAAWVRAQAALRP